MEHYIFFGAPILSLFIILLIHAYWNIRSIGDNWSEHRCNPLYMPLAGIVDPKTGLEGNFNHCMNMIGKEVVADATDAIGSELSLIEQAFQAILSPLKLFRELLSRIRKFVLSFATSTLDKATGPVSTFVYYLNKIQDLIRKMVGEGYIATFFGISAVSFIEGFVTLCISVIKGFVYAMLAIAIVLAFFQPEILAMVLVIASMLAAAGA
jgi:hypothetical protein